MKFWRCFGMVGLGLGAGAIRGQVPELIYITRGESWLQRGNDEWVRPATTLPSVANWFLSAGGTFLGSEPSSFRLFGPAYGDGVDIPPFEDDPLDYELEIPYATAAEFAAMAPAGEYSLKVFGWDSGAWEEPFTLPAYDPVAPKGVADLGELQDIDPRWPVTLELLPFADLHGKEGFIEIEVYYDTGYGEQTVWSSEDEQGGDDMGLPVDTPSVTIPGGRLTGNPARVYEVCFSHVRIEALLEVESFASGQKGIATLTDTFLHLRTLDPHQVPGHINLPPNDWHRNDQLGWIYGLTPEWGYSNDLGWIYVAFTPRYVYQTSIGWMMPLVGSCESGLWFYGDTVGWAFTSSDMGGWYQSLSSGFGRFHGP